MIKRELALFLIVGSLTVLIDFLTYQGLIWLGLAGVDVAKGASFLLGTCFAYFANRIYTFGHQQPISGNIWRFIVLYTVTLGVNVGVNALMLHTLDTAHAIQLAFLLATGVSAVLNFAGMKWIVFKASPAQEPL